MKKILACFVLVLISLPAFAADKKESVYDRVMRTNTIRCGYASVAPYFLKDPATGALSGIWYEYTEEMGKWLNLKIDWAEETGYGDVNTALESGRIDAFCSGIWVNPSRARVMDFVTPVTYQSVRAYVRDGDKRFDGNTDLLNAPEVTVSCLDGEMAALIATEDLPQAKALCLPQMSPFSDMLMNVVQKKADVTFCSPLVVKKFNESNPPGLREVKTDYPARIFPESMAIARGENDFRRMLDHTTGFLINSGKIEKIIRKYSTSPDDFMRVTMPYQEGKQ